jgi:putative copper export protein
MQPEYAFALLRSLQDISAAYLWGAYAFLGFLVPQQLSENIQRQLAPLKRLAILLVLLTTVLSIFLQVAVVGEGWADSFSLNVLTALFQTGLDQQRWSTDVRVRSAYPLTADRSMEIAFSRLGP